jgi:hypothetical protein
MPGGSSMSEKFDPAPADKHAEDRHTRKAFVKKRRGTDHDELDNGLKESFPASDPVSSIQPKKTLIDNG